MICQMILSLSAWDYCILSALWLLCAIIKCLIEVNPFLGSYVIESEHQPLFFFFWRRSLFPVCSLTCFLGFFGLYAWFVYLECVHLSTPATYGREGNGLRAGHEGRKCPETNFLCEIRWATTGTGAHIYLKTWEQSLLSSSLIPNNLFPFPGGVETPLQGAMKIYQQKWASLGTPRNGCTEIWSEWKSWKQVPIPVCPEKLYAIRTDWARGKEELFLVGTWKSKKFLQMHGQPRSQQGSAYCSGHILSYFKMSISKHTISLKSRWFF